MRNDPTAAPASDAPRPRVLIADDDRTVRSSCAQQLREHFEVREATDGDAAWQAILLDSSIRAVLADVTIPKVDALELLTRVRGSKVQRIRELPVIVMGAADDAQRDQVRERGATDVISQDAAATELLSRLQVLVKLSATREALIESQASLESARTVDPDTELLNLQFFDKQVERLISYARRNLTDVALICIRVELSMPQSQTWEGEGEQRAKLVGRALAASIRLEDLGTRSDKLEFCVASQSSGLSGVLRFAARLRKVLENVEAAGPGVEVWTCIGVSTLSEDMRRSAEEMRVVAQKRAQQAQTNRSRRIVLGAAENAGPGGGDGRSAEGSVDVGLAIALIKAGRSEEVVPHLPALIEQITPLLALIRQQRDIRAAKTEGTDHGRLQGDTRSLDP